MERDIVDRLRAMAGPIEPNVCTEAADEIERLRGELVSTANRLTEERDEARRMWCEAEHLGNSISADAMDRRARAEAKRRGWDCFKEASK